MSKEENVNIRVSKDWKTRLKKAADTRGLSVSAYVINYMEDQIRADLTDYRDLLKIQDYRVA